MGKIRHSSKIVQLNLDKVTLSDDDHIENMKFAVDFSDDMKFIDFSKNSIHDGDDLESVQSDSINILEKSYKVKESFISLLFCNSLQANLNQAFHVFCNKNDINVYKITSTSSYGNRFRVDPVHVCKIKDLPQLICIIFETKLINNFIYEESEEDEKEYIQKK